MSVEAKDRQENRRIVLVQRPQGAPKLTDFCLETAPVPAPGEGQVLLQTLYLSLDPYMRGRMSEGPSYASATGLGEVMPGGVVSRVVTSRNPQFQEGELVLAYSGWQEFAITDGEGLMKLDPGIPHPSLALGVLGMPGFTAYMGLLDIGNPQPGETVVVAAVTGAVGAVVGQIAKLKGCRVVGIAGGSEKCRYATEELGLDACLDHRAEGLPERLAAACPQGIDVYFENVGGAVLEAVLPLLNPNARVPVCGLIAHYNAEGLPDGPDKSPLLMRTILTKRVKMQGYIIFLDYGPRYGEFLAAMLPWVREGKIRYREDVVDGLENAPAAFLGLLEGKNFGKLVVRVTD